MVVSPGIPAPGNYTLLRQSDIVSPGLWVNGTQLANLGGNNPQHNYLLNSIPQGTPKNTFPFKRLARFISSDGSTTYLYYQMNGTTFAEEKYDWGQRQWLSTEYFTVSNN